MDELYSTLVEAEAARDVNAQKVHALLSENKAISEQSQLWSDEISRLSCSLEKSLHERSEIVEYVKRELVIEKESLMSDLKVKLSSFFLFFSLYIVSLYIRGWSNICLQLVLYSGITF